MSAEYICFRVYRGLQKPLEFMMLKGRYVVIGAAIAFGSIVGFIVGFIMSGILVASLLTLCILLSGGIWIITRQRKGLHSKNTMPGFYIVTSLIKMK